jgi:hypothetical protein
VIVLLRLSLFWILGPLALLQLRGLLQSDQRVRNPLCQSQSIRFKLLALAEPGQRRPEILLLIRDELLKKQVRQREPLMYSLYGSRFGLTPKRYVAATRTPE